MAHEATRAGVERNRSRPSGLGLGRVGVQVAGAPGSGLLLHVLQHVLVEVLEVPRDGAALALLGGGCDGGEGPVSHQRSQPVTVGRPLLAPTLAGAGRDYPSAMVPRRSTCGNGAERNGARTASRPAGGER